MRAIARFGAVSLMGVMLMATGVTPATAQADVCVSVRSVDIVPGECRSTSTSLTIGVTNPAGVPSYLKLGEVRGESRNFTVNNENSLLGITLDPD